MSDTSTTPVIRFQFVRFDSDRYEDTLDGYIAGDISSKVFTDYYGQHKFQAVLMHNDTVMISVDGDGQKYMLTDEFGDRILNGDVVNEKDSNPMSYYTSDSGVVYYPETTIVECLTNLIKRVELLHKCCLGEDFSNKARVIHWLKFMLNYPLDN